MGKRRGGGGRVEGLDWACAASVFAVFLSQEQASAWQLSGSVFVVVLLRRYCSNLPLPFTVNLH